MQKNNNYIFKIGSSKTDNPREKESIKNNSKKTGRPLKVAGRCKTKYVKVFCTEEDYLYFQKYCEEQNISGSEMLYRYLRRMIRSNKKI